MLKIYFLAIVILEKKFQGHSKNENLKSKI